MFKSVLSKAYSVAENTIKGNPEEAFKKALHDIPLIQNDDVFDINKDQNARTNFKKLDDSLTIVDNARNRFVDELEKQNKTYKEIEEILDEIEGESSLQTALSTYKKYSYQYAGGKRKSHKTNKRKSKKSHKTKSRRHHKK
jgi:hypothetical protein